LAYLSTSLLSLKVVTIFSKSSSLNLFLFPTFSNPKLASINKILSFFSCGFDLLIIRSAAGIDVP